MLQTFPKPYIEIIGKIAIQNFPIIRKLRTNQAPIRERSRTGIMQRDGNICMRRKLSNRIRYTFYGKREISRRSEKRIPLRIRPSHRHNLPPERRPVTPPPLPPCTTGRIGICQFIDDKSQIYPDGLPVSQSTGSAGGQRSAVRIHTGRQRIRSGPVLYLRQ